MALVLTAAQMQRADRWAIDELGVPGLVLMENAGRGVVRLVQRTLGTSLRGARVDVVCGAGQNGGDGFVIARHLVLQGVAVRVWLALPRDRVAGDAAVNLRALERMGSLAISDRSGDTEVAAWAGHLAGADAIVDAIFGTGLKSDVAGAPAAAIAAINDATACKIAVDLPSGMDADSGQTRGIAVRPDVTATLGARKPSLVLDASAAVGEVHVVPLGVPLHAPESLGPYLHLVDIDLVAERLPPVPVAAHKNSRGHVLLIAGSGGKTGAALLCARAALRGGAGLVTVASTAAGRTALDAKLVEAMSDSFCDGDDTDSGSFDKILGACRGKTAVALGPGVPTGPGMRALTLRLVKELALPLVVDADGLNHLGADAGEKLRGAAGARVLTPHPGEAARLLGVSPGAIESDRLGSVRRLARDTGAVVVLKGARSLSRSPTGRPT